MANLVAKILVEPDACRAFLGQRGLEVEKMALEFGCSLRVSEENHPCFRGRVVTIRSHDLATVLHIAEIVRDQNRACDNQTDCILLLSLDAAENMYCRVKSLSKEYKVSLSFMGRRDVIPGLLERWLIIGCGSYHDVGGCLETIVRGSAAYRQMVYCVNYSIYPIIHPSTVSAQRVLADRKLSGEDRSGHQRSGHQTKQKHGKGRNPKNKGRTEGNNVGGNRNSAGQELLNTIRNRSTPLLRQLINSEPPDLVFYNSEPPELVSGYKNTPNQHPAASSIISSDFLFHSGLPNCDMINKTSTPKVPRRPHMKVGTGLDPEYIKCGSSARQVRSEPTVNKNANRSERIYVKTSPYNNRKRSSVSNKDKDQYHPGSANKENAGVPERLQVFANLPELVHISELRRQG